MIKKYESKLMECIAKMFGARRTSKYDKKSRIKEVIRCKQAEQVGDYKKAYETLLRIIDRNLYGADAMKSQPSHNFTLKYNIPVECIGIEDKDVVYAVAAMYNLYWMGFPHPCEHFEDWSSRFGWNKTDKFYLRADNKNAYLGELHIITKEEYDNPLKFRPELRSTFEEPVLGTEYWINFRSGEYDDIKVKYKVLDRGWSKNNRVYLECEGHYYEYSWQFCLG